MTTESVTVVQLPRPSQEELEANQPGALFLAKLQAEFIGLMERYKFASGGSVLQFQVRVDDDRSLWLTNDPPAQGFSYDEVDPDSEERGAWVGYVLLSESQNPTEFQNGGPVYLRDFIRVPPEVFGNAAEFVEERCSTRVDFSLRR